MGEKEASKGSVSFVKWFSELNHGDVKIAGGKGASLGEMYNNKFPIPPGFVVTAQAYSYFIEKAGIKNKINEILDNLDVNNTDALNAASKEIRGLIESADFPEELKSPILESYEVLDVDKKNIDKAGGGAMEILKTSHEPPFVAVRSSATAEDLVDASFAGQQESFLNVKGNFDLIKKVKKCFSSLFTPRAIFYREKKGFKHSETELAVVVQKMIDSEKSGVMFSKNPVKKDESILIEAVWGLGEGLVSGRINPDIYVISRDTENLQVLKEKISYKKIAVVRDSSGQTGVVKLTEDRGKQRVLSNYEVKRLGQYAIQLEEHYELGQDIEFAIENNQIYIVQSRPITTKVEEEQGSSEIAGTVLLSGLGASPGVGVGVVRIVKNLNELSKVKNGDILVTEMTNPDMVVTMQKSAAIVTDEGGLTSHAAIVSREMGIPAVVGTGNAIETLKDGQVITVDGSNGKVFEGRGETKIIEVEPIEFDTKTKIKVIVDLPDYAERAAKSEAKGVGLVRLEGIIASGGKHPLAYIKEKKVDEYIKVLSNGLKDIVKEFDEIWIRSSDIRTDEFRNLIGASKEVEGNPMLGDHGIRFSLRHPEILRAEFTAIKEIADEFPDKKIGLMAPQIISISEVKEMKRIAKSEVSIPSNVKIGVMVETPAAVMIIDKICEEGIDFISFGTNDLTQYTLAIDRNNSDVQYLYDEAHPAVLNSMRYVIQTCKRYGTETSICGQAGSKPEIAEFLVKQGIDSISVNADVANKLSKIIKDAEENLQAESGKEAESVASVPEEVAGHIGKPYERKAEAPLQTVQKVINQYQKKYDPEMADMEELVLKELESEEEKDEGKEKDNEYFPGTLDRLDKEIPNLNEAIAITSGEMEEPEKEEEEVLEEGELLDNEEPDDAEEMGGEEVEKDALLDDELGEELEIEDNDKSEELAEEESENGVDNLADELDQEIAKGMIEDDLGEEWGSDGESNEDVKLDIF
ncbi:phosphoenolpyruvate synthase [Candidatus Pacearchaeota archaeon]|nr:phosphoenolpyruvate synthase [Candidatus Pacearchaeota archaeon]|tara:strand:- start:586 stop:3516 length:2931 start_codon:yes stop_codon:yes gene_type:complete